MNKKLYNKIAYRLSWSMKRIVEAQILMQELDGGLAEDLSEIEDRLMVVYEVLDERKDRGEYNV